MKGFFLGYHVDGCGPWLFHIHQYQLVGQGAQCQVIQELHPPQTAGAGKSLLLAFPPWRWRAYKTIPLLLIDALSYPLQPWAIKPFAGCLDAHKGLFTASGAVTWLWNM